MRCPLNAKLYKVIINNGKERASLESEALKCEILDIKIASTLRTLLTMFFYMLTMNSRKNLRNTAYNMVMIMNGQENKQL